MPLCLDASAALAALLPRHSSDAAERLVRDTVDVGDRFVVPPLLFAEATSVLRRYAHIGAINRGEASGALQDLFSLPIELVHGPEVYLCALDLAHRLGHAKAHDVQYLAVAQMKDCTLLTLDSGLYESARSLSIAARLIE